MEKLRILAESAKYDVSCSSSGTVRKGKQGMVGSTVGGVGICHSFADDGRCISLLKVMLTNYCMYDCAYCINRRSNDIKRATLSVSELEEITMEFYRRNYIEGLFLSSGVVRNPDYTMERLTAIARDLRTVHRFNGYIHLKSIPGASQELLNEAGRYADRMSVNIEIPKEESLKLLAPEKDHQSVFQPMRLIQQGVLENKEDRKKYRYAPRFVPAGQSTQMIVGATKETDRDILTMSSMLYGQPTMRRVYYSGYVSVNTYDPRLPVLKQPPLVRENRLYQADWLLRFYPVADVVLRRVGTEILDGPAGIGGGHEDEGTHLCIADGPGLVGPCLRVVHEVPVVRQFELHEPVGRAAYEHQRRDQLLLNIGQAAALVGLDGMVRHVRLDAFGLEQGLQVHDPVVEYLQGVPVESLGGRFDEMLGHKAEDISPTPRPSGD